MAAPAWHIDKGQWLGMLCVAAASLAVFKLLQVVAACVYKLWVLRAMPGPPQHLFVGNLTGVYGAWDHVQCTAFDVQCLIICSKA